MLSGSCRVSDADLLHPAHYDAGPGGIEVLVLEYWAMPRNAQILSVLIASPGDVSRQRDVIQREVEDWNRSPLSRTLGVRLESLRWELDAIPELGRGDAQSVINRQLRDDADVVVGVFHSRIGTRTLRAESGTAEEIEASALEGKRVHVYVDMSDLPRDHDPQQLAALKLYLERLSTQGLLREIASDDELARHVRLALDHDVAELLTTELTTSHPGPDTTHSQDPAVAARDELNRSADAILAQEGLRPDAPMDGTPAWASQAFEQRQAALLRELPSLLRQVIAAIRTGDPIRNEAWLELIPDLATNPHRGGITRLLELTRAPGSVLFHLAGATAAAVRNDALVARLLSAVTRVDDPYKGIRPAVVSLRAQLAFPTDWPSRDLAEFVVPLVAEASGDRAAQEAWERWTYLAAVAMTYFNSTLGGVWVDHPYLRVEGEHRAPLRVVVAGRIRDSIASNPNHPFLQGGLCDGNADLFREASRTFESNYGEWALNMDWQALPPGGGTLPSGPHYPGQLGA